MNILTITKILILFSLSGCLPLFGGDGVLTLEGTLKRHDGKTPSDCSISLQDMSSKILQGTSIDYFFYTSFTVAPIPREYLLRFECDLCSQAERSVQYGPVYQHDLGVIELSECP